MSSNHAIIGVSDHGGWAVLVTVAMAGQVKLAGAPVNLRRSAASEPRSETPSAARDLLSGFTLLDRRRVQLVDADLPKIPHHSEAQRLPLDEAVALVERVRASAERHAKLVLDSVATTVSGRGINSNIARVAPPLSRSVRQGGDLDFSVERGITITGIALRHCPALPPTIAERIKDYRAQNVADWVMYRKALAAAAEARGWAVHWYQTKSVFNAASRALGIEDLDGRFLQLRRSIGPPWSKDHKLAMAAAIVARRES